jgi:beta-lactam-binding protein with PASTA domain
MKKAVLAVVLIGLLGFSSILSAAVDVPNVIGMDLNRAAQELQKAGLKPGNIAYVNTPKPELTNKIAGQGPPGGTKLSSPQPVNLTVYRLQAEWVTVPNVVGMDYPRAMNTFIAAGFTPKRRDKNTNVPQENEKVFGQGIAAGQKQPKGAVIELIVNKLVIATVTVPDVTKMSLGEAQVKLLGSGLTAQALPQATPTSDPKLNGKVASQNPQAGNQVPKGSVVKLALFVSQVVEPPSATVVVPDIVRMSMADATAKLSAAGLKPEVVPPETPTSDQNLHTKISYQNPRSGTQVPRGSFVKFNIFVYMSDDLVTVPNVIGMKMEEAFNAIKNAGFKPPQMNPDWVKSPPGVYIKVVSQNPPAGQKHKRGAWVSTDLKKMTLMPNVVGMDYERAGTAIRNSNIGRFVGSTVKYTRPTSDPNQRNKVFSQKPPQGAEVEVGPGPIYNNIGIELTVYK